jgi:hypothetical protein
MPLSAGGNPADEEDAGFRFASAGMPYFSGE